MKLSELKKQLDTLSSLDFTKTNGQPIPAHFHITEVGLATKHFIDCGGELHVENLANIQIWVAEDLEHRLTPSGLLKILATSERVLGNDDLEIEMEYQTETIGKYDLDFKDGKFILVPKHTDCLAKVNCGIPKSKQKLELAEIGKAKEGCCTPGGGCC